jgi:hypothetical protein
VSISLFSAAGTRGIAPLSESKRGPQTSIVQDPVAKGRLRDMRRTPATAPKTGQRAHDIMRPLNLFHAFCGLTISRSFPNYFQLR